MTTSSTVTSILEQIAAAGKKYGEGQLGSRESLIDLSLALVAQLEIPSEFVQRTFWAEVSAALPKYRVPSLLMRIPLNHVIRG